MREQPAGGLVRTFSSLRVRNFRLFIVGQLLSATGTWMQGVAAPWLVLQLTGSGVALGIDTALQFLPMLLFGAWGGVFADRFDNRRILIWTQIAYSIVAASLWGLVVTDVVRLWMVYALSFIAGCVTAIDMPTRQSFYLELVGANDLTNAMSLNTATFTGARIIGPVIAGELIAAFGTAPVFLINAISYLAVVVALLMMRTSSLHERERVPRRKGQIREGIRYVWRTPELRLPLSVMAFVFTFAFNFTVVLPLLAVQTFHATSTTYGWMLALFGAGSLVGALLMASRATRPNTHRLAVFAMILGAVCVGAALAPILPALLPFLPVLGGVGIAFAITGNSTMQLTASSSMRGRVMSLYSVVFLGSTPIGAYLAGWVGQHVGARFALAAGGVVALLTGLVALTTMQTELRRSGASEPGTPGRSP